VWVDIEINLSFLYVYTPNVAMEGVALLRIPEVLGSNLGPGLGYPY
jgi:hypothetical protein